MAISIFIFLAVVIPLVVSLFWGPKLSLIKAVWILAAILSIVAGVAFIGSGTFSAVFGLLLMGLGVFMVVRIFRPHFNTRMREKREHEQDREGLSSWLRS
jgi:hypothetical protein